jgi:two-component system OmpR family sensor kinase
MLAGVLASFISAALLAWHFAKPIRNLRSAFDAVAAGKLEARIVPAMGARRDELADLGQDFDHMAARLQELVEGQRRLLHDVSHELRSPLARLQAAIGLARQRPEKTETMLERIERESARMDGMIGELLTLSRLEAGVSGLMDDNVDLCELVAELAEDARFEARAAGKDVIFHHGAHATVRGRAELLHSAIENVVRNAVRHTPPSSNVVVTVDCSEADDEVHVAVRDHGSGVPEEELDAIFKPFVRSSTAQALPGHGLGLAIAQRVVKAHGGTISASNAEGGGLRVEIRLPTA